MTSPAPSLAKRELVYFSCNIFTSNSYHNVFDFFFNNFSDVKLIGHNNN